MKTRTITKQFLGTLDHILDSIGRGRPKLYPKLNKPYSKYVLVPFYLFSYFTSLSYVILGKKTDLFCRFQAEDIVFNNLLIFSKMDLEWNERNYSIWF